MSFSFTLAFPPPPLSLSLSLSTPDNSLIEEKDGEKGEMEEGNVKVNKSFSHL